MADIPIADAGEPGPAQESVLVKLLEKLTEQSVASGLSAGQLETLLERVGFSSAEAMRQSLKPENQFPPEISAFSYPEGDRDRPKPSLTRKTYFCGVEERADRLTPAEIDSYNAIVTPRRARRDRWAADIKRNGLRDELWISVPMETYNERVELPALILILHELNGGHSTENVYELVKLIEHYKGLAAKHGATAAELEAEVLAS